MNLYETPTHTQPLNDLLPRCSFDSLSTHPQLTSHQAFSRVPPLSSSFMSRNTYITIFIFNTSKPPSIISLNHQAQGAALTGSNTSISLELGYLFCFLSFDENALILLHWPSFTAIDRAIIPMQLANCNTAIFNKTQL